MSVPEGEFLWVQNHSHVGDPAGQGLQGDDADDAALAPQDQAEAVAGVLFELP